jgi:hypothetical protein
MRGTVRAKDLDGYSMSHPRLFFFQKKSSHQPRDITFPSTTIVQNKKNVLHLFNFICFSKFYKLFSEENNSIAK